MDACYPEQMRSTPIVRILIRYLSRLRFPQLFLLTAAIFVINVIVPDPIPFVDEILLALATRLLGSWKKQRDARSPTRVEPVDI